MDYNYSQRAPTPEGLGFSSIFGGRYRSGSGSVQHNTPLPEESRYGASRAPFSRLNEGTSPYEREKSITAERPLEHSRSLSLNGPVQRPSSQPQRTEDRFFPMPSPPSSQNGRAPTSGPVATNGYSIDSREDDFLRRRQSVGEGSINRAPINDVFRPNESSSIFGSRYSRPHAAPSPPPVPREREPQPKFTTYHSIPKPPSPEIRRTPFADYGNRSSSVTSHPGPTSQPQSAQPAGLLRQDSQSSQPERSIFGERLERQRSRVLSPFSGPSPQRNSSFSEEQLRKGDELHQHRSMLNVSADGRRNGRASPLPQAVQGAQPGPDNGIKKENARVFSGIGSGAASVTPQPYGPQGPPMLSGSPFATEETVSKSESRSKSTVSRAGKRSRKVIEQEGHVDENGDRQLSQAPNQGTKKPRQGHQ